MDITSHPRGAVRPEFCLKTLPHENQRAQGRPDARCTRGLAGCCRRDMLPTSIQVQRRTSGLPHAMALRLIRFRPGDRLDCHHHRAKRLLRHALTPAPGRRTQTISPYATDALVFRTIASTAPCPSFATMAHAPLAEQDGASFNSDLPDGATGIFLREGLDITSGFPK